MLPSVQKADGCWRITVDYDKFNYALILIAAAVHTWELQIRSRSEANQFRN